MITFFWQPCQVGQWTRRRSLPSHIADCSQRPLDVPSGGDGTARLCTEAISTDTLHNIKTHLRLASSPVNHYLSPRSIILRITPPMCAHWSSFHEHFHLYSVLPFETCVFPGFCHGLMFVEFKYANQPWCHHGYQKDLSTATPSTRNGTTTLAAGPARPKQCYSLMCNTEADTRRRSAYMWRQQNSTQRTLLQGGTSKQCNSRVLPSEHIA
ncbi:hypothetical protein DEU56DRAFT_526402 [Suillus clintonianus]|uniref:uncharacterized protein n=1 Tax=Suillus clintonianus TaxID=1904413 RepID=UPI001B886E03|nr:uncharacterized protein DEU56DRAFT_526402 [Suillus clintonianus]KAG2127676.1 hypothetical protein DEU56DRAFT_526402 [Suillus clintonianus]